QLTRDGGKHWRNVTPPGAPEYGAFDIVAPSSLVDGAAYAVNDGHFMGDNAPYVFVTHDFGRTWNKIVNGLPKDQWARSIRPDIHNRDLVYLGTENGIWISFDGGTNWQSFKNDMPTVSVHDIRMQPQYDDIVVATHGRDVYIMDDVRAVQDLGAAQAGGTWVSTPRTSYEWTQHSNDEGTYTEYAADNPPYGVMITFYQKEKQKTAPAIDILDASGRVIRRIAGTHKVHGKDVPYVDNTVGINRYTWDFNVNGPVKWDGGSEFAQGPDTGPGVLPGQYSVRMTLGGRTFVRSFRVEPDPRSIFTMADYRRSYDTAMRQMNKLSQVDAILNRLDDLQKSIDAALVTEKKSNNTALIGRLNDATAARKALFDTLATDIKGEGTQDETKLHEDLLGTFFGAQQLIVPPTLDIIKRVDVDYRAGIARYNDFVRTKLPGIAATLKDAGTKTPPSMPQERPL
ncbi:MAG TPA: hypothetical protein VGF18_10330, partial [Candidatus Tumulicola sp.]